MRKRWFVFLLSMMLIVSVGAMPSAALAADGVSYIDANGATQRVFDVVEIHTGNALTSWSDGWYIATGECTIEDRVVVSGHVHLILANGATLTVKKGITVQDDDNNRDTACANSLTIYAQSTDADMGTLVAGKADSYHAGIGGSGGDVGYAGGVITINGGNITAKGGSHAAGIGGGGYKSTGSSLLMNDGGTITINGGNVIARGGDGAAGIGGGGCSGGSMTLMRNTGGVITITGGVVDAKGGTFGGSGIGGGMAGSGGTIAISGGTVVSKGGFFAAGIGGGGLGGSPTAGNITISGGNITATGNMGAADIGGGYDDGDDMIEPGGSIIVTGGEIKKSNGQAANISAGEGGSVDIMTFTVDYTTLDFGNACTGYDALAAQTITITNTGNQQLTLQQPTATNFTIGSLSTTVLNNTGDTATFTITPKTGLAAGTFTEVISIRGSGSAAAEDSTVAVTFTVTSAPPQTGDSSHPVLWTMLAIFSAATLLLMRKRWA